MSDIIQAIVIDGFHKGHCVAIRYHPTLKLLKPRTIKVDYCCDNDYLIENPTDIMVEYKECFRGVDGKVVLYSVDGDSTILLNHIPIKVFSDTPWNEMDTLYIGYHNEPIRRKSAGKEI